jgi:multiple RNA-binding domain-containing protein 1
MSRIRILNLPPSVTEASLTKHFQSAKLPPTAPPLIITDCSIKRGYGGADGSKALVRMAFIGFKTAAAGQFAVRHFNGSYYGTSKIGVEAATGLQDTAAPSTRTRERQAAAAADGERAPKRPRGEAAAPVEAKAVGALDDDASKKKEFVASRRLQNSGPTWAKEMMLPPESPSAVEATVLDVVADVLDDEAGAFQRQAALEKVDDMDFLTSKEAKPAPDRPFHTGSVPEEPEAPLTVRKDAEGTIGWGEEAWNDGTDDVSIAHRTRRVRFGNLPYSATEEDVKNFASSSVGPVAEVHLPLTRDTKQSKGAAFVKFASADDAVAALTACSGAIFMGRLLRVSAADDDPYAAAREAHANSNIIGAGGEKLVSVATGKRQSEYQVEKLKAKKAADGTGVSWSAAYMSSHTAVESVAKRLGTTGSDLVNVSSAGAAVRAAISEAFITSEAKKVLSDEGIDFSALESGQSNIIKNRSNTTILAKNLSPACDFPGLVKLFSNFGSIESTAIPDSAGFALFSFVHAQDARVAFQRLAYKNFSGSPLFLEWAPVGSIKDEAADEAGQTAPAPPDAPAEVSELKSKMAVHTLFLSNLPFNCTQEQLEHFLQDACPRLAGEAGWRRHVQRLALQANKGWAFLTVADEPALRYVLSRLQGKAINGRQISCQASKGSTAAPAELPKKAGADMEDAGDERVLAKTASPADAATAGVPKGCNPVKLIVKNLPFEATEADLRELFAAFTEVKAVRVPKKLHQFGTAAHRTNNHRGFGFVEFLTAQEARNALKALSATHLYGRHLVLQYAKMDEE